MEGGALLGQGTFGCVFSKPLLCNPRKIYATKQGNVGKITEAIDIENEIMAAKILKDVKGNYFVLPNIESVCKPVDFSKQPDSKSIKECNFIKNEDIDNILHYTMPYGGIAIRKMFKGVSSKPPINLLSFAKHILEGGALLALHGYVHYDVHQENILLNKKTFEPCFIDFGMSFSANNITNEILNTRWKVYSPDFDPEPPEITVITALRKNHPLLDTIHDIIKQKPIIKHIDSILGVSKKTQLINLTQFCNTSTSIKTKDFVSFFKSYWSGFDSWGIGVVIFSLLRNITMHYMNPSEIPGYSLLKKLCKELLKMNPRDRIDCVEALLLIDPNNEILKTDTGRAWKKEKDSIRNAMKTKT